MAEEKAFDEVRRVERAKEMEAVVQIFMKKQQSSEDGKERPAFEGLEQERQLLPQGMRRRATLSNLNRLSCGGIIKTNAVQIGDEEDERLFKTSAHIGNPPACNSNRGQEGPGSVYTRTWLSVHRFPCDGVHGMNGGASSSCANHENVQPQQTPCPSAYVAMDCSPAQPNVYSGMTTGTKRRSDGDQVEEEAKRTKY